MAGWNNKVSMAEDICKKLSKLFSMLNIQSMSSYLVD